MDESGIKSTTFLPMMNGIGNDKPTCDEVHNHNQGSNKQADVGISHFEIGHPGLLFICQTHMMVQSSGPYQPPPCLGTLHIVNNSMSMPQNQQVLDLFE